METKTKIAGIELNRFVLNASGVNDSTLEELEEIAKSDSAAVMTKSCTIEPRKGSEEPRYFRLPLGSIQSMGLPNLGYKEYLKFIPGLKKYGKPVIVSVAGFSPDEYRIMVKAFQESEVDLIEINLSCPNIEGKQPVAYNLEQAEEILSKISDSGEKPIGLKLPPYFDFSQQEKMAGLIKHHNVSFISSINALGNTLVIDSERETPVIKPNKGFGGLCGDYIKPIALANVRRFYELLKDEVSIMGVGGIKMGQDAFEFLLAGADAVQVGTVFEKEGINCFERINRELQKILERKGYSSVSEAKGKLKYL